MSSSVLSTTTTRSLRRATPLWAVVVLLIIVAAAAMPSFRDTVSVSSLLTSLAPIVAISTGQAIVVMLAGIDLSVGAVAGLATVLLSFHSMVPGGAVGTIVLPLLGGLVIGLGNGLGVVLGINPLLMTFAMGGVAGGIALLLQSASHTSMPMDLVEGLGFGLGPVPVLTIVTVAILVGVWLWTSQSRLGRVTQAAGFDERIARRVGLPVTTATMVAYGLSGVLAAVGGLAIAARTYTADALVASTSVIDSVSTVLVAGIVITGGVGSILSVLPAALLIAVVGQVITLSGVDPNFEVIFEGVLLVAAVSVYRLIGERPRVPWRLTRPLLQRRNGAGR